MGGGASIYIYIYIYVCARIDRMPRTSLREVDRVKDREDQIDKSQQAAELAAERAPGCKMCTTA